MSGIASSQPASTTRDIGSVSRRAVRRAGLPTGRPDSRAFAKCPGALRRKKENAPMIASADVAIAKGVGRYNPPAHVGLSGEVLLARAQQVRSLLPSGRRATRRRAFLQKTPVDTVGCV